METKPVTPKAALSPADIRQVSPALASYTQKAIAGDLWKRPDLSARDRSIATVSALVARNQTIGMLHYFNLALDSGLKPAELSELITHLAFYAGWSNAFFAVDIAKDIFEQRGISLDQLPDVSPQLLPIDKAVANEAARLEAIHAMLGTVSPPLEHYTNELLYHDVWLRPDLTPRDRSLATVSALIALGDTQFLPFYLSGAFHHGLTKAAVSELLAHLAFYAGWTRVLWAAGAIGDESNQH